MMLVPLHRFYTDRVNSSARGLRYSLAKFPNNYIIGLVVVWTVTGAVAEAGIACCLYVINLRYNISHFLGSTILVDCVFSLIAGICFVAENPVGSR